MPLLSPLRAAVPILQGLVLLHRGKVRDTYDLGGGLLLVVCTDGISIFDFVLNCLVPEKGMILMAMTHFWLSYLETFGIRTHLVAAGAGIDQHLPENLRGNRKLQSRAMVVRRLSMHKAEFIARIALTGSVLNEYRTTGSVYGHKLPPGLEDGDLLPYILDTPTTKADEGHDEPLDAAEIRQKYPQETLLLLQSVQIISAYAKKRGIFFADTKKEMGLDELGNLTIGDEVGTPDSSRFWDLAAWILSRKGSKRKAPPPFDKQLVRLQGIEWGLNDKSKFDPENPADVARVHDLTVPPELVEATTQTYRYIFWRLVGMTVEDYLDKHLGVPLLKKQKNVDIVFGSESDIDEVRGVLAGMGGEGIRVHVISCHRNPGPLRKYVNRMARDADVIIAAGGKALALPGVLDAHLHESGQSTPVIGVALGNDLGPAQISISELPGQPVVMDEINGRVYSGKAGLREALERALFGELPPPKQRTEKSAKFGIDSDVLM